MIFNSVNLGLFYSQGVLCRTLQDHGHWVNTLALNTDYAMRTATIDFLGKGLPNTFKLNWIKITALLPNTNNFYVVETDAMKIATTKYNEIIERNGCELLVSGSDDWSLRLWTPEKEKKSIGSILTPISFMQT